MSNPMPQPGILEISPYVGGDSKAVGANRVTKLSSNENPHGPSPRAIDAYREMAGDLATYPSSDHAELRQAIGEVHGLDPARVICGAGSDEIIAFLCQAYVGPGDEVIHTEHGFAMYRISTLAAGGTPIEVAENARVTDVDAILAAVTDRTRLIFIANPNNPTGTMIGEAEVTRLVDGLPETCLLVLDGAYAEYVPGFDAGARLVETRENVVMTRTFSKIYGLGALRLGWGYGSPEIIDVLNRIRGPFNLSSAALAAGEAAVRDVDHVARCRDLNTRWRAWLADELAAIGLPSDPAHGNFITIWFGSPGQVDAADAHLRGSGVIARKVAGYNLPKCLRITIGDEVACRLVVNLLSAFMGAGK